MKKPSIQLTDKSIFLMGAFTLYGFSLLAFGIVSFFIEDKSFYDLVFRGAKLPWQILHGLLFGLCSFAIINVFIRSGFLEDLTGFVNDFASKMNWVQIVFISFAAGVGEELLFRVAIQYFFGVWPTAFLFVLIHGYLNLSDWRVFTYGVVMTILSAGFGLLYIKYGIAAAMMAHFIIDLLILGSLKLANQRFLKE